jgi:putative glutamine amidotransferase
MKPLVLIPGRHSDQANGHRTPVVTAGRLYGEAIMRAGGIPLVLAPTHDVDVISEAVRRCDAVVFLGGGDVCPHTYGRQESARLYGVDETLDIFEKSVFDSAISRDIPILAICRGHQMLNVAMGGTLIQHLDTTDVHRDTMHDVDVVVDSRVATAMGTTTPQVHSFHHQAIDDLGKDLVVVATHNDGTIEAVEHAKARWVVGVQWHPEDTASQNIQQQGLFDELVRQAIALPK